MSTALEAFRRQLQEVHGAGDAEVREGPPGVAVPGFTAFEAVVGGAPVRGWARPDGEAVLFARQNFGLVLDAVDFAAEPPGMGPREVVDRLVWMHGPAFELAEHVPAGELGLDADVAIPVERRRTDGGVQLSFAVREREHGAPFAILHYRLVGADGQPFRVELRQLAPPPEDE